MAAKVIDASAIAALLFGEPEGAVVAGRLAGAALFAPALLWFELANICLKKMKRHPEQREKLVDAFGLLGRMVIEAVEVEHTEALMLAEAAGLTAYDASYLWLARRLGAELVTLDRQLDAAAQVRN